MKRRVRKAQREEARASSVRVKVAVKRAQRMCVQCAKSERKKKNDVPYTHTAERCVCGALHRKEKVEGMRADRELVHSVILPSGNVKVPP